MLRELKDKTYFIADFDRDWNFVQSNSLHDSQLLETFRGRTLTDTDKLFAAESLFNIDDLSQGIGSSILIDHRYTLRFRC